MNDEKTATVPPLDAVLTQILTEEAATSAANEATKEIGTKETEDAAALVSEGELAAMSPEQRKGVYGKLAGLIDGRVKAEVERLGEDYRRGIARNEDSAVKTALSHSDSFRGFGENIAAIDGIIEKVPVLSSLPAKEKYTLAYLIHQGIRTTEREAPSAEEVVKTFRSRPDAVRLFEAERSAEMAADYASTPAFSASCGTASMPATVRRAPRTLEEASREAYAMFGL